MRIKTIVISFVCMLTLTLSACGSDSDNDNIDTQAATMSDGRLAVVITNQSEDDVLKTVQIKFDAYDDEGNVIEYDGFHPRDAVVSIFPGESSVAVNDFDEQYWLSEPAHMDYSIEKANWGNGFRHVAVTDTSENYYQNYNITIKNEGSEDIELGAGSGNDNYNFFAFFRDDEGKVTGISEANVDDFDEQTHPVIAAGEEINTTAEVNDVYPGTCHVVLSWIGSMTQ